MIFRLNFPKPHICFIPCKSDAFFGGSFVNKYSLIRDLVWNAAAGCRIFSSADRQDVSVVSKPGAWQLFSSLAFVVFL